MMERKERKKKDGLYIVVEIISFVLDCHKLSMKISFERRQTFFFVNFLNPFLNQSVWRWRSDHIRDDRIDLRLENFFFGVQISLSLSLSLHRNSMEFFLIWFKLYQKKAIDNNDGDGEQKEKKRSHFDLNDFVSSKLIVQFGQKIIAIIAEKVKDLVNYYRFGARKKNFQQKDGGKGKMIWFKWIGNNFSPI